MNNLQSINPFMNGGSGDFVYFIYENTKDYIKIGCSNNIVSRLRALQQSSPRELIVLGLTWGTYQRERDFHKQFAEYRVRGEWFKCHEDIMNIFSNPLNLSVEHTIKALEYLDTGYPKNYQCPCVEVHTCGRDNE